MRKLVAIVSASLLFAGLFSGQATALSALVQSDSALTPFSSIQKQPKILSEGLIIQASASCVVNWVNGGCAFSEFIKDNNGGNQKSVYTPPVYVPPIVVEDGCVDLRVNCGGECCS